MNFFLGNKTTHEHTWMIICIRNQTTQCCPCGRDRKRTDGKRSLINIKKKKKRHFVALTKTNIAMTWIDKLINFLIRKISSFHLSEKKLKRDRWKIFSIYIIWLHWLIPFSMTRSNAEYYSINYFSWLLSSTVNMRFLSTFGTKFNLFNFASLLIFRVDFTILVFFYVSLIQIYDIFSIFFSSF